MALNRSCPGSLSLKEPKPEYQVCSRCGYEVEIWTDEFKRRCPQCGGLIVKGRQNSCIDWCQYAKLCVGDETYARIMAERQRVGEDK